MDDPFASIDKAVADARAAWRAAVGSGAGVVSGVGVVSGAGVVSGVSAQVDAMSEAGIIEVNERLAAAKRHLDALHAPVAAGIASRSAASMGSQGLARKSGHRTPAKLIAAVTGGHAGDAARLIQVGEATAGRMTFSGERTEPKRSHVAAAIAAGAVNVAGAAAITTMLDKLELRVDRVTLEEAEQTLVGQASLLSLDELNAVLRRAEAVLDPDGLEPKIDELRSQRSLVIREDHRTGQIIFTAKCDPETAAPIKAAIEAIVTHQLRTSRGQNQPGSGHSGDSCGSGDSGDGVGESTGDGSDAAACRDGEPTGEGATDGAGLAGSASPAGLAGEAGPAGLAGDAGERGLVGDAGPAVPETRSVPQMQADALAMICRHALGCDNDELPLESTTVVVRMPLEAVLDGTGVAEIDGITQPIDAGTARRMAASARVIPCVLGGDSEVLDLGRTKRFFTYGQRLALVERDGGCASCGLPPGMCEGHHILWWDLHRGSTDLANGILLCTACHHRIHNDGWQIRIDPPPSGDATGGTVWFIPPVHVDPEQRPRLGGRKRFDYAHRHSFGRAA